MPIITHCEICGKEIKSKPYAIKRGRGRFCSRKCFGKGNWSKERNPKYKAALKTVHCLQCGKAFDVYASQIKNGGDKFCSYSCKFKYENTGNMNGNWKGGKFMAGDYMAVSVGMSKRKYEHQAIAERILNRSLKKGEVVHHINGKKTDNRNSNLLICEAGYHHSLHQRMAKLYQQEHFAY